MSAPGAESSSPLRGSSVIGQIKKAGIRHVLSVPDLHTSAGLLRPISQDPDLNLIRVCKEDECFGIAAGLTYGNIRSMILVQFTGFLYAINAIRGIACEQQLPICFMIGMLGKEPGVRPTESRKFGLRIVEPMLDTLGIRHACIETDEDAAQISSLVDDAWRASRPVAILIGGRPEAK
ncbi:MAG: decarboxylase [Hyphomicrobiales bacterium]|jgi:sulfopyruvate decarboxylase subunit alpha|nr:decarboxylase [Hyphomicrobiales bacterium]